MQVLTTQQMQDICDCVYLGMTVQESLVMANVPMTNTSLEGIARDKRLLNLVRYARTKAKRDMLAKVQDVIQGTKTQFSTLQMLKHMLSTRFGLTENRFELKQKSKEHLDNLKHKRELMRQWAEFQTTKMVNEASHEQLETWAK